MPDAVQSRFVGAAGPFREHVAYVDEEVALKSGATGSVKEVWWPARRGIEETLMT